MKGTERTRWATVGGAILGGLVLLQVACGQAGEKTPPVEKATPVAKTQAAEKKEYVFRGKVEDVDAKTKSLNVNGENVEGWMAAMTMRYGVDKDDVVDRVKVGDTISAKVRDGDFKTLYDVQVVPPAPPATPPVK